MSHVGTTRGRSSSTFPSARWARDLGCQRICIVNCALCCVLLLLCYVMPVMCSVLCCVVYSVINSAVSVILRLYRDYVLKCQNNCLVLPPQVCPTAENFTWPDAETRTRCLPIPATFVHFSRLEGQLLLACDLIVFFVTCTVCAVYLKNRHSRLIKASSRELSLMMLCGHVITCFLVVNFVLEPTSATCVMSTGGFHLSFTWSYGPLLVKTNRIYRIFMPGKAITKKPLFIGSRAQVVIAAVLIASQVGKSRLMYSPIPVSH